eukprot:GHVQ01005393.1.p1 GENE.GHVQ01005393.1~~GHVQ01005393.1.p1  ORF type:complete len:340 (+),score=44.62 GHVQ01005393.1:44-1021(+)
MTSYPSTNSEKECLEKFKDFNWADQRWQTYLANLYPVPPANKIIKWKKKFYQKSVDPSFNIDWEIDPPPDHRPTPSTPFTGTTGPVSISPLKIPAATTLVTAFVLSLLYLLPFNPYALRVYMWAWGSYLAGLLLELGAKHGRPRCAVAWWQAVVMEDTGQMLLFMFFTVTHTRNPLLLVPLAITAAIITTDTLLLCRYKLPTFISQKEHLFDQMIMFNAKRLRWMQIRSDFEIGLGAVLLLLILFTGGSGILSVFLYFHFIKLRYSMSGFTITTFTKIDDKLTSLTQSPLCPGMVGYLYPKIRGFCRSLVAPPAAGGGGRLCTVQ